MTAKRTRKKRLFVRIFRIICSIYFNRVFVNSTAGKLKRREIFVMTYGYARCSTNEKKQDVDRQKRDLKKLGVDPKNIFWEYESGMKNDRVHLDRLMNTVKEGDTIVALEVSRLTRSTQKLCNIIDEIKEKKLKLIIDKSITVDCTPGHDIDPMTKGMLMMWGVFAELEHDIICQRVKSGMENARAKGVVIGRPKITEENIPAVFMRHYPKYIKKEMNVSELSRLCGMSRTTIYKYIKILEG